MEEFLQRAKSKLNRSKCLEKVHVVIGPKSCDLDSLISAFTYAYFLDKVSPPGILCLPVLNIPRTEFNYFTETRFILEELNISESFHIFRDEINLHQLNDEGKLSITLVGSSVLASEDKTLESAVVKVISPVEHNESDFEFREPSSSLVLKELLQEAPELITEQLAHLLRGSILFKWLTMDSDKISEKQEEIISILEEKFPNLPPREDIINILQETQFSAQGLSIEQTMLKDLKELSDGEIKVAISTVNMALENCLFHSNITSDLKAFTDKFGFDVLILFASYLSEEQQPRRQIAVYSQNLELCSQICCELEESQNPCLELEPFECGCDEILVYQQVPSVTCDQVVLLIKEVINRRCPEMVSNSRTSSTEAVAGSAPLSQGSSGIMELYGSDIEPQPSSVNFIENPPDLNDSNQAQVDVNVDLVSPDSGLATIRSSRSSKESSVFLSDDSPVGEGAGSHHSLLPGFDSYSPIPEGVVAEEHVHSGEHREHFDLFNFDSAPMVSGQSQPSSHSADYSPADDFPNSDSSEGQLLAGPKGLNEMGNNMSNYSSSSLLSEAGKDSLVEFDEEFDQRQESFGDSSERNLSVMGFMGDESLSPERLENVKRMPPTPMNSFVESSPPAEDPAPLYPENTTPKEIDIGHLGPPQTHAHCRGWWSGLEMDSKNIAEAWSSSEQESVFQSPESWKDQKPSLLDRKASDSMFQPKNFEFSKSHPWESDFGEPELGSNAIQNQKEESLPFQNLPAERSHLPNAPPQETNHLIEDFSALWRSDHSPTIRPEPWGNPVDGGEPAATMSFPAWSAFSKEDNAEALKTTWNLHPTSGEIPSVRDPSEWAMAKSGFSFPSEDLLDNSSSEANNEAAPNIWGEDSDSRDQIIASGNPISDLEHARSNSKPPQEDQDGLVDPKTKGKIYQKVDSWNLFEESVKKGGSDILAPWEDSFLYKCSDYSASNVGEDSVPSPLDTNYSTSDSYTSPTFTDEKETENKPFSREEGLGSRNANSAAEEAEVPLQAPPRNRISSGPGNLDMWASPHTDKSSETDATHNPETDILKTECREEKKESIEDDLGESSQSSYDDPSMMQLYNETNRQLTLLHSSTNSRAAPDNLDLWNRVILEDTQSTATISDMDNDLDWDDCSGGVAINSDGQAEGYVADGAEPETRFSVRQLEPWGTEYQEANQVDWEPAVEHANGTGTKECHTLNEKSGQLIANSIWDSVVRDEDMSAFRLPGPPYIPDSQQSSLPIEKLRHSANAGNGHTLEVLKASEISESAAVTPHPDSQVTWIGTMHDDTESLVARLESPGHFAHSDPWIGHPYGQSETEKVEVPGASNRGLSEEEEVVGSGEDSASGISGEVPGDQELSSPVASKHQEVCVESDSVHSLSATCSPQTKEPEEALEYEKEAYNQESEKGAYNQEYEEGAYNQEYEEGAYNQEYEKGAYNQESEEGAYNQEYEEGAYNQEYEKGAYNQESEEGAYNQEYEEGAYNQESEEGAYNQEYEEGAYNQEYEEGAYNQEYEEGAYNEDSCDEQTGMSTNNLQAKAAYEEPFRKRRNSDEITEISGGMDLTKNVSLSEMDPEKTEECDRQDSESTIEGPPREYPKSLGHWDGPIDSDVWDSHASSAVSKTLGFKGTEDSFPGASPSGNYDKDSISSAYTHSSASSPDLHDSLASLSPWSHGTCTGPQKEDQDDWSEQSHQEFKPITSYGQVEVITEMKDLEKNRMDKFENSIDHKVPDSLEIWNESVDGDSLSSSSSPETGKYPEYASADGERNLMVSHQEENSGDSLDTVQPEDAKVISTGLGSEDVSVGNEESGGKEDCLVTHEVAQSKARAWDSLNESKFLATSDPKTEEFSDSPQPAENAKKPNPFCDSQQNSTEHWNFSPPADTDVQITAVEQETRSSLETVKAGNDVWQMLPHTGPKDENHSKLETLGFSAESIEWWAGPAQAGGPRESGLEGELSNSSGVPETNSPVYQNVAPWERPIQGDTESMETHSANPFDDKLQSPFLDNNGDPSHEQLWNIQPRQPDSDTNQVSQLVILDQIKAKDTTMHDFISSASNQLPSEIPPEPSQETVLSDWDQSDPASTHTEDNGCVIANLSTTECQEANLWKQEESYLGEMTYSNMAAENFPTLSSPAQLIKNDESEWDDSSPTEDPQGTFVPDILHSNIQEGGRLASASPDLWVDVKQPSNVKADGENPDILTHCDQDSNSQASISPDLCHNSEAKQETEQHAGVCMESQGESSKFDLSEPKMNEEPSQEPGQESALCNSQLYSENALPVPAVSNGANANDWSQSPSHSTSPEPFEMHGDGTDFNASEKGPNPDIAPVPEPVDGMNPRTENVGTSIFVTRQEPTMEGSSSWVSEDFSPESQTVARAASDYEQPSAPENPAAGSEALLALDTCLDVSEAAFDHSLSDASGLNTSTGTIDDMSKLTLSEGHPETPLEGDAGRHEICSSEASWGDFEYDVMGQNIDEDFMKEPEHFVYGGDPPWEEDALTQSLAPFTPPFDLSYLTEPTQAAEATEEAGSPEDVSLGSEAAEMLLSALPDQSRGKHTKTHIRQPEHQRVVLHIHEDPEPIPLPVGGADSNTELSPSNIDWEVETSNSDSPAGGDMGPPNGASKEILEKIILPQETEQREAEYKEEGHSDKGEDHHALHMDYILVNNEKNSPLRPEACEVREKISESGESHVASEETGRPGTQLASFPDTSQPASLSESKNPSVEKTSPNEGKRSSVESPAQDPSWMVLGHGEIGDPSLEARDSETGWFCKTMEPFSDLSLAKGPQIQALEEMKPPESLALEEVSGQGSQSRRSRSRGRAGPDVVLLQPVTHDNEWEMLSPQSSQKNRIRRREGEEETQFFDPETRKPRPKGLASEDVGMDIPFEEGVPSPDAADMRPEPPNSLDLNGTHPRRVKLTAPNINLSLDQSEGSILSDDNLDSPDEIDINVDELDTPDEADSFEYPGPEAPTANKDSGQESESIPEYTAEEEREDNRLWRTVVIGEQEQRIDMKVIEPYRRVIAHGGYYGDGLNAIIVFAACFLPDSSRADYHYVMENLFLYVISTLELMVAEDYMIVYLNGATPRRKMPGLGWMKKCYQMIDRRLRKNLKSFIIVHPSWFIRTILAVTRPFISSKFSSKIKYVNSLSELSGLIPMDCIHIPESIIKYDEERSFKRSVRLDEELREASEAANIDLKLKEKP